MTDDANESAVPDWDLWHLALRDETISLSPDQAEVLQKMVQQQRALDRAALVRILGRALNLRRKIFRGRKDPRRRILMRHVPHEARFLGRLKRGVKERKSHRKAITSRENGSKPPRPQSRPRGRPRASQ